jgi:hypothetical protein
VWGLQSIHRLAVEIDTVENWGRAARRDVRAATSTAVHASSATIVATVSGNRKAWWDDILWWQVRMMRWSRFPKVGILDTKDEKAILRNWFDYSVTECE